MSRSPKTVAKRLAKKYGHQLRSVSYIPALAVIGRLQYADLLDQPEIRKSTLASAEKLAKPFTSGKKSSLGKKASGSVVAGHLVFGKLYDQTQQPDYLERVRQAADVGFNDQGEPLESMPNHNQMSDSVFMGCAILAQAGRLTGEDKYFQLGLKHLQFMQQFDLRDDGIYRHSPLDEAAWGRGNGFPALGLALVLTDLPQEHPTRETILQAHRQHLLALCKHQDYTGCWHQVVDHPESYREFTSTCMIGFALARGIRLGWLGREPFDPHLQRAWQAAKARVAIDASLVDVCTGTGKQKSLRNYLDRTAILGFDDRGGAMGLLFATEMMQYSAAKSKSNKSESNESESKTP